MPEWRPVEHNKGLQSNFGWRVTRTELLSKVAQMLANGKKHLNRCAGPRVKVEEGY